MISINVIGSFENCLLWFVCSIVIFSIWFEMVIFFKDYCIFFLLFVLRIKWYIKVIFLVNLLFLFLLVFCFKMCYIVERN